MNQIRLASSFLWLHICVFWRWYRFRILNSHNNYYGMGTDQWGRVPAVTFEQGPGAPFVQAGDSHNWDAQRGCSTPTNMQVFHHCDNGATYQCVLLNASTELTHRKHHGGVSHFAPIYPGGFSQHLAKWTLQEIASLTEFWQVQWKPKSKTISTKAHLLFQHWHLENHSPTHRA